jgi:hypothetical protein
MAFSPHDHPEPDPADVVRAARSLLATKKQGRHFDLGFDSFAEYAASLGIGADEARDLLDLARVLVVFPELEEEIESGEVTLESVRVLAPVVRDPAVLRLPPGAEQPLPVPKAESRWVEAALDLSPADLRIEVSRAVEQARVGPQPLVRLDFDLPPGLRADLDRACRLASEIHERPISPSELIAIAAREYLEEHDRR